MEDKTVIDLTQDDDLAAGEPVPKRRRLAEVADDENKTEEGDVRDRARGCEFREKYNMG